MLKLSTTRKVFPRWLSVLATLSSLALGPTAVLFESATTGSASAEKGRESKESSDIDTSSEAFSHERQPTVVRIARLCFGRGNTVDVRSRMRKLFVGSHDAVVENEHDHRNGLGAPLRT